jgi:adenylate cyclase
MAIDFEAEGLLDGLSGREREARIELLDELAGEGVPVAELHRAVEEDRLALLPVDRALHEGEPIYTLDEMAERAGVDRSFLERDLRALGLAVPDPEEPAFGDADVEFARAVGRLREAGIPDDDLLDMARVIAVAMAQVAAGARALIGDAFLEPGDTERDAARRFAAAARGLGPLMGPMLGYVFNAHLREQLQSDAVGREELMAGRVTGAQEVTVCFADLVGFTRLGERLPAEQLGAVTDRLTALVSDVAAPPVRIVKLIGDAAMLVSPQTGPLLDAALSLVDAAEAQGEDFPRIRAGVARGLALPRGGDWYGRPVNLASRITGVARPESVLCEAEVRASAGDGYRWSAAGTRHLKGIRGQVRLYRVRRDPDALSAS